MCSEAKYLNSRQVSQGNGNGTSSFARSGDHATEKLEQEEEAEERSPHRFFLL